MNALKRKLHTLLRASETYTKTDMVYVWRGTFWVSLGQFFSSLSSFILSIAFGHLLTPAVYGVYKYALTLSNIIGVFSLSSLSTALLQAIARGYEGVLRRGFWLNLRWSIPITLISFGLSAYYFMLGNTSLGYTLIIIGITTPILNSASLYSVFFYGRKDFRSLTSYTLLRSFVPMITLLGTLYLTKNPLWLIAAYFFSNMFTALTIYILTIRNHNPNDAHDEQALTYGKHLSLINIVEVVADNLDQILVFHYLGAAQLAIYSFAIAMPQQIKAYLGGITSLILPRFSARSMHEIRASMGRKMLQLFLLSGGIALVYIVAAPFIFKLFFPLYTSAIFYSQIVALSLVCTAFSPAGVTLTAKRRTKDQYKFSIATSTFQIIIVSAFLYLWGILGLVLARIATRCFGGLMYYYFYTKIPADE